MVRVVSSIHELIGGTPVLELRRLTPPGGARLFAKLECFNPGGSVKDRLGLALIEEAERSGQLRPGGAIIEATAGNTGIGLALGAIGRGYRVIFCIPEKVSSEKKELMRALGAELVSTPSEAGMVGAAARARELAAAIPGAYFARQFENQANPDAHYATTGPEIWQQMDGQVDAVVIGAGTGGTFTGVARYLKEQNPRIRCCVVEPEGSVLNGGVSGPHKTEGIGVERLSPTIDLSLADAIYTVSDEHAFETVKALAAEEGVLAGSSSGAACWAALQERQRHGAGDRVVVIFPDSAERYLSKQIYQGGI